MRRSEAALAYTCTAPCSGRPVRLGRRSRTGGLHVSNRPMQCLTITCIHCLLTVPADIFTSRVSNFLRYTPFEVRPAEGEGAEGEVLWGEVLVGPRNHAHLAPL